jgi:ribosomal protein S18 acetylase RimI-like enzyme
MTVHRVVNVTDGHRDIAGTTGSLDVTDGWKKRRNPRMPECCQAQVVDPMGAPAGPSTRALGAINGVVMTVEVEVRRARVGDEDALSLVGQATFLETFSGILDGDAITEHCRTAHSPAQYLRWLRDERSAVWLACAVPGSAPVGYVVVATPDLAAADPVRDLELKRIYLLGRFQGGGLGKKLLRQAVQHAERVGASRLLLGVYAGNHAAIAFYTKRGFAHLADRQFVVGGTAYDDHVMSLELPAVRSHASHAAAESALDPERTA